MVKMRSCEDSLGNQALLLLLLLCCGEPMGS